MEYRIIVIDGGAKEASHKLMLNLCIISLISLHCTVNYLEFPLSNFKVTSMNNYGIEDVLFDLL